MNVLRIAAVLLAALFGAAAGADMLSSNAASAEWRGVHVMEWGPSGGDEGVAPLKRAIDEVLAPLGVNVLVYEVGYNFEFESHPDMRFAPYITKAAARDLAAFCRARNIRLIPQFNCLGHQSWAKMGGMVFPLMANHPEMEEVPDVPESERPKLLKSWCPLHPGVNPIVFDLLDEIAETFGADALHVGMDEVLTIASPKCPRCAGKPPAELFAKAVNDLHAHLVGEKGLTMLMWGDRLLEADTGVMGPGWEASDKGTAPAIDFIPKDIVICDWHYSKQADYPSVRLFLDKGFRVWPASWKNSEAALAFIDCAYRENNERVLGYLGTSWVIQPGQFALALLGEGDAEAQADRARPAADSLRACMEHLKARGQYELQLDTPLTHYDKDFLWFHPRVAAVPGAGEEGRPLIVMTLQKHLHVSDYYSALHYMLSRDLGKTWTEPAAPAALAWDERPEENEIIGVCDVTPNWHAPTGKVLAIGAQVRYKEGHQLYDKPQSRAGAYAVYDPAADAWSPWRRIEMPDPAGKFYGVTPGCVQWLIKDGGVLLPIYFNDSEAQRYRVTVLRCTFDGETLAYAEHGDEMSLDVERGLCEPSLARFGGAYYLTIRNDQKGYVTRGSDGLHFEPIKPWTFDDCAELGSYNTQQHWITRDDALYLVYTRRGAGNDHIMRHRAPLFMAKVDPERLCVMRSTERVLIPQRGATLGNFGAANVADNESWVTVSEGIWSEEALKYGAKGDTFIARIKW